MREWSYTALSRAVLGCTSPPTSRFPSALEMSLRLRPRDISRASGNLLVVGDVQPNTSLLSAVYGYNPAVLAKWSLQGVCYCMTSMVCQSSWGGMYVPLLVYSLNGLSGGSKMIMQQARVVLQYTSMLECNSANHCNTDQCS